MNTIGILGCGWLGIALGEVLKKKEYTVRGTRRGKEGIRLLKKKGIAAFQMDVFPDKITGDFSFFDGIDTLIISIPPDRKNSSSSFVQKITTVLNIVRSSPINRILFLSSTSVYGNSAGIFNEYTVPNPQTTSAKALYEVEQKLLNFQVPKLIIRLGGLVGEDRNPFVYLQDKKILNPNGCINFIHQIDAVNGISALLNHFENEGIYNLVSPHHPTRKEYYTFISEKLKLSKPQFKEEAALIRIIEGKKITRDTSFSYFVNNLLI